MIRATLYYLDGAGDVEQVRKALASIQEEIPHELLEIDVSRDAAGVHIVPCLPQSRASRNVLREGSIEPAAQVVRRLAEAAATRCA